MPRKYVYRWHEGGHYKSRSFTLAKDRDAFKREMERRRQLGSLASSVLISKQTLADFVEADYWPRHAIPNLAVDTRRRYLEVWGTHLLPRLGDYPMAQITPSVIEDAIFGMNMAGVGLPTQRKALMLLQGILNRAVTHQLIPMNPAQVVRKPRQAPTKAVQPLAPETIEAIRALLRPRDATIVSILAYAGLRPSEDRGMRWGDVHNDVLAVFATKTGRSRDVDLLAPLAQDLRAWKLASPYPTGPGDLIVPRPDGGEWTRDTYNNWRSRVYRPAALKVGAPDPRPYCLRASFVSLLLWAGEDLAYIADQAGHSVATLAKHYAGVMRELRGKPRVSASDAIMLAREQARMVRAI